MLKFAMLLKIFSKIGFLGLIVRRGVPANIQNQNEDHPRSLRNEAERVVLSGDFEKAIPCYTTLLDLNGQDIETLVLRGAAYSAIGKHEEALADLNKALQDSPKNPKAHYIRG